MSLDREIFLMVQELVGNPLLDKIMLMIAKGLIAVVPLILAYLFIIGKKGKKDSLYVFAVALISLGLSYLFGLLYFHKPPFELYDTLVASEPENAFPSQHTTIIFASVWPLFWRSRKKLGGLALIGILIGFSRIFVGEHFPIDILGGIMVSVIGFCLVYLSHDLLKKIVDPVAEFFQEIQDKYLSVG